MPKQKRWQIKRELDQAAGNVRKGQAVLVAVGSEFESFHPEIYVHFCLIVATLEETAKGIDKLKDSI